MRGGGRRLAVSIWALAFSALLLGPGASAEQDPSPLKPADTSSPRATLESFIGSMNELYRLYEEQGTAIDSERAIVPKSRAIRCLDQSGLDLASAADLGARRAVQLMEVLDRVELPLDQAPDATAPDGEPVDRWRIPETDIVIARVGDGPRAGEYLFSSETVARIPEFFERSRPIPYRDGTILEDAFAKLFIAEAINEGKESPLKPADTSNPRATLKSFIDSMNASLALYKADGNTSEAIDRRQDHVNRALSCLDLSQVPPNALRETQRTAALLLMEVLDRIDLPAYEQVPGPIQLGEEPSNAWTLPATEITIARVEEGPRAGEYLFTPETVARSREFYRRVEHLPYKEGTVLPNAFELYMLSPEPPIPNSWVRDLPAWMRWTMLGQVAWKWLALGVILLLFAGGMTVAFRFGSRRRENDARAPFLRRVVFPICGIVLPVLLSQVVSRLRVSPEVSYVTAGLFTIVVAVGCAWLLAMLAGAAAEAIIATPRINSRSIDAQMVRIAFQLVTLLGTVYILLETTHRLGIPLTPVLAGLGVGGIAVALAAQNSIENLLGGLNLFVDRPVKVGDFCRFGDQIGTIEEIGLRSTRIRSLDDTVITVPNATFSKMELENYSRRRKILYRPRIQLEKRATPCQVRSVLEEVRRLLREHPKVDPDPARIRFSEFGTSSLDLDVYAYVTVTDYGEFLGVSEDLNLSLMDILSRQGVALAVPLQRTILERPSPLPGATWDAGTQPIPDRQAAGRDGPGRGRPEPAHASPGGGERDPDPTPP